MNFRSLAYHRLSYSGDDRNVDGSIVEFMEAMCDLEADVLQFEADVAQQSIGRFGWVGTTEIRELEHKHQTLIGELQEINEAIVTGNLSEFDRNPAKKYHDRTRYEMSVYREDFIQVHSRLENIVNRVGRRIDSKRNTANTRLVFAVSFAALVIAMISLIPQIIQLIQLLSEIA